MKKFKVKFLAVMAIIMLSLPVLTFAQGGVGSEAPPDQDAAKALDWAEGSKLFDDWFMENFLLEYRDVIWGEFDVFIDFARVIAGIFTLIFFATRAYGMMTGDEKWEILPLLRPFGLLMIIFHWQTFVLAISFPTDVMAASMWDKQEAQQQNVTNKRLIRAEYQRSLVTGLFELSSEAELAADESKELVKDKENWFSRTMKEGWNEIIAPAYQFKYRLQISFQLAITQALEAISLWLLRVAVYSIFTIQIVFSGILIMLGPISVATSILPMFRDSFQTWIARFISVNLYLTIALIIMFIGGIFQEFAMESEILRFQEVVDRQGNMLEDAGAKILYFLGSGILSFGVVIITFLVTAICMTTVPSISTWVISTSGVNSAISTIGRAAGVATGSMRRGRASRK